MNPSASCHEVNKVRIEHYVIETFIEQLPRFPSHCFTGSQPVGKTQRQRACPYSLLGA